MNKKYICGLIVAFGFLRIAYAGEPSLKYDASFQISVLDMREHLGEKALGVGGRFGYRLSSMMYLDGEIHYFPEDPSGNFGQILSLGGIRVGKEYESIGIFAKARAGTIRFDGKAFSLRLSDKAHPAFDLGVMLEYYTQRYLFVRMDIGDCIIPFKGTTFLSPYGETVPLGTQHNLLAEFGFGIRF
jgi:hypothetical protein